MLSNTCLFLVQFPKKKCEVGPASFDLGFFFALLLHIRKKFGVCACVSASVEDYPEFAEMRMRKKIFLSLSGCIFLLWGNTHPLTLS